VEQARLTHAWFEFRAAARSVRVARQAAGGLRGVAFVGFSLCFTGPYFIMGTLGTNR
jgi:uncharacterized membrane protein YedE/YeeE